MEQELPRDKKRLKEDNELIETEEDDKNQFSNDGSFLELFKRRMKEKAEADSSHHSSTTSSPAPANIKSIQVQRMLC